MNQIGFPGLGLQFNIDPIAIPIKFLPSEGIRWYAIFITLGVVLAYLYITSKEKKLGNDSEIFTDMVLYGIPISIVGARLYYVLFSWDAYKSNLVSIFWVWEGGIAIYGGIIAALAVVIYITKKRKLSTFHYLDLLALGFLIGQILGRWGNFMNAEAYGTATNLPWRMAVPSELHAVHPTFLYESLWNLILFVILHFWSKKKPFDGSIFCAYLVWYGTGRFFIEGLRTDSLYLIDNVLRVSQLVSVFAVISGIVIYILLLKLKKDVTCDYIDETAQK